MVWQSLSTLICGASLARAGLSIIDLSESEWTVSSDSLNISVPGSLPSQVHLDLYKAEVIGDPYYGLNDFNLRWVANSNWTYTTNLTGLSSNSNSTWLLFNGLDTFATVDLCGKFVASTNNQFRQYYFDVTGVLQGCANPTLSIDFGSAPRIADAIAALPGQETWPFGVENLYEYPNRQFIRKEQSDFGWDWGPAFAPAGPWQPAYVLQFDGPQAYVRNTLVDIYRQGQVNLLPPDQTKPWVLNASIDLIGHIPSDASVQYKLIDANNHTVASGTLGNVRQIQGTITGETVVPADKVQLWWPVGFGNQTLYTLDLSVRSGGTEVGGISKRVGFRTIVLNELPISKEQLAQGIAPGNNWHFEVNGNEFYAKGSNFIPPDAFWPRVDEARIRKLFTAVVAGNQNMLRVWASGAYSPDFMYDLADEMGILLWSEFEFSDALYPIDQGFIDNVKEEVTYQIRRINHHPSLALWAGGNELESLELSIVYEKAPELLARYTAEYERLFIDTIGTILFQNSRSISYTPSSTSNGWVSLNLSSSHPMVERYANATPGAIYGDTDHYDYDSSQAFNLSSYPIGRFANEFGFLSMPSRQTWEQAVPPNELYFNSTTVVLRNHHDPPGGLSTENFANASHGMAQMTIAVELWYPVPDKTDPVANFSAWCLATQIFQADYYKSQIEYYRRGSGMPERQLGSLYWQLEDIWQAPTWAGIEYDGRWKVLHYTAKDIYQNIIIAPYYNVTTDHFSIYVTSDLWSSAEGIARLVWFDWSGKQLNISTPISTNITVGALNTTKVIEAQAKDLLKSYDVTNVVLGMYTQMSGALPNTNETSTFTHTNFWAPAPLSKAKLVDPGLKLSYSESRQTFTITATLGIAVRIWLDYPSGTVVFFDDNGFWLAKGQSKEIGYEVQSDTTNGAWIDRVTVQSLWNQTLPE